MKEMNINILRIKEEMETDEMPEGMTALYQLYVFLTEPDGRVPSPVECFWLDWDYDLAEGLSEDTIESINYLMSTTHDGCDFMTEVFDAPIIYEATKIQDARFDQRNDPVCVVLNYGVLAFEDDYSESLVDWVDENRGNI